MGFLAGKQWQPRDLAALCYEAGWTETLNLVTAIAVCLSESQGYQEAQNDNKSLITEVDPGQVVANIETYERFTVLDPPTGRVRLSDGSIVNYPKTVKVITSRDVGLFQINIPAAKIGSDEEDRLFVEPHYNVERARQLFEARGFQPWYGYTLEVYLRDTYIKRAVRGVGNFMGDELLKRTPTDTLGGEPYVHTLTTPLLDYQYRVNLLDGACSRIIQLARAIKPLTNSAVDAKLDEVIRVATIARNEAKK